MALHSANQTTPDRKPKLASQTTRMRYYFFRRSCLPFDDLDEKRVDFNLSGRKTHPDIAGRGQFDLIKSGGPGRVRLEIRVTLPDLALLRIPIPRSFLKNIRREPASAEVDFSLNFRMR